jgi:hypothetical protein
MPSHKSPVPLLKLEGFDTHNILWVQEKDLRYVCLSEAKALHSHKAWTEVSSSSPHPYGSPPLGNNVFSQSYVQ